MAASITMIIYNIMLYFIYELRHKKRTRLKDIFMFSGTDQNFSLNDRAGSAPIICGYCDSCSILQRKKRQLLQMDVAGSTYEIRFLSAGSALG